jgi:hypothetical protein
MVMFHSYGTVYQRVTPIFTPRFWVSSAHFCGYFQGSGRSGHGDLSHATAPHFNCASLERPWRCTSVTWWVGLVNGVGYHFSWTISGNVGYVMGYVWYVSFLFDWTILDILDRLFLGNVGTIRNYPIAQDCAKAMQCPEKMPAEWRPRRFPRMAMEKTCLRKHQVTI